MGMKQKGGVAVALIIHEMEINRAALLCLPSIVVHPSRLCERAGVRQEEDRLTLYGMGCAFIPGMCDRNY